MAVYAMHSVWIGWAKRSSEARIRADLENLINNSVLGGPCKINTFAFRAEFSGHSVESIIADNN